MEFFLPPCVPWYGALIFIIDANLTSCIFKWYIIMTQDAHIFEQVFFINYMNVFFYFTLYLFSVSEFWVDVHDISFSISIAAPKVGQKEEGVQEGWTNSVVFHLSFKQLWVNQLCPEQRYSSFIVYFCFCLFSISVLPCYNVNFLCRLSNSFGLILESTISKIQLTKER